MRVGRTGGVGVTSAVEVGPGSRVRGVFVTGNVAVGEGVTVEDGVAVGIVGVRVGVSEAVAVGTVEVGNGPSSACDVPARAVLVPLAIRNRFRSPIGPRNENQIHRIAASNRARTPIARMLR
jgi:hypothetical protein